MYYCLLYPCLSHRCLSHRCLLHRCLLHRCLLHRCLLHRCLLHRCLLHRYLLHRCLLHRCLLHRYPQNPSVVSVKIPGIPSVVSNKHVVFNNNVSESVFFLYIYYIFFNFSFIVSIFRFYSRIFILIFPAVYVINRITMTDNARFLRLIFLHEDFL